MKAVVIGASGIIGSAVARAFEEAGHEVLRASRRGEVQVDIADSASIRAMYDTLGTVDAVVCCAGEGTFAKLGDLSDEQIQFTLSSKLMGQVNLVREGMDRLADGGVFVLTSGMFSYNPIPGVPALAMANGGIESFGRGAALDLPRGLRIGTICPPFITETAEKMGMSTSGTLSAADNAEYYLRFVEGDDTGVVVYSGR
jgi:NAD(P)-dependent dehydrogenase (short-subunit alcohol dehydrogenase family)